VTERNIAVDIQAFGTTPPQTKKKVAAPHKMLALPKPGAGNRPPKIRVAMAAFLVAHKAGVTKEALGALLVQMDFSAKSLSGQLHLLKKEGLVRKTAQGLYIPTAKALKQ